MSVMAHEDEIAELRAALERHPIAPELTPRRLQRVLQVVCGRLLSVTVVMENLADSHNVSAVVRTAEAVGLERLHVVEQPNKYEKNKAISKSADRWIEVQKHQGLARCLGGLQAEGFAVYAADVGEGCTPLSSLPSDRPVALVFGSEHDGLSKRALSLADGRFTIPMWGFVESFNVSVSVAVALAHVTSRRRDHLGRAGDVVDRVALADRYLRRTIKNQDLLAALLARTPWPPPA
jgi:tRNA (guanosine-2'-O-)-methyltransferase